MKKTVLTLVLLCGTIFCTTKLSAQKMDSTATAMLNGWVNKYKLTAAVSKQIKPYILAEEGVLNKLASQPASEANTKKIDFARTAYSDTIKSILIQNGHYGIEDNRFTNALRYSKRLNLTNVQVAALVADNLTLDRQKHTFVPTATEEKFSPIQYYDANLPTLFNAAQYDTLLAIEERPQATKTANASWKQLKANNLLGNNDSATVMNDITNYWARWHAAIKKQLGGDTSKTDLSAALKKVAATKPVILQQLDLKTNPKKAPTDPTLLAAFDSTRKAQTINKGIQAKMSSLSKRYSMSATTQQAIHSLVKERVTKVHDLDSLNLSVEAKDSLKQAIESEYDNRINAQLESQVQWAQCKQYGLTTNLDSASTINSLNTYNLQRLTVSKKLGADPTNTILSNSLKAIWQNKPVLLKRLAIASRSASNGNTGNYAW